jgi:hypothetical protein
MIISSAVVIADSSTTQGQDVLYIGQAAGPVATEKRFTSAWPLESYGREGGMHSTRTTRGTAILNTTAV